MTNSTTIEIPLTHGYKTIIDETDLRLITKKMQVGIYKTSGPYALHNIRTENGVRPARFHRLIMEQILGRTLNANESVDHIDGDGLNNRRSNLRLCTHSTNAMNSKQRSDNKSGYKGVCFHKLSGLWRSYIRVNKKQRSLGYYKTPEQAHEAYKRAAVEYYGEFARFE